MSRVSPCPEYTRDPGTPGTVFSSVYMSLEVPATADDTQALLRRIVELTRRGELEDTCGARCGVGLASHLQRGTSVRKSRFSALAPGLSQTGPAREMV